MTNCSGTGIRVRPLSFSAGRVPRPNRLPAAGRRQPRTNSPKIRQPPPLNIPEDSRNIKCPDKQALTRWDKDPARLSLTKKIAKAMLEKTAPEGDELLLDYGTAPDSSPWNFARTSKRSSPLIPQRICWHSSGKNSLPPQSPPSFPLHGASATICRNCPGSISSSCR